MVFVQVSDEQISTIGVSGDHLRGLDDNDITSQERRGNLACGKQEREVPRDNGSNNTDWGIPTHHGSVLVIFNDILGEVNVGHPLDPPNSSCRLAICLRDLVT